MARSRTAVSFLSYILDCVCNRILPQQRTPPASNAKKVTGAANGGGRRRKQAAPIKVSQGRALQEIRMYQKASRLLTRKALFVRLVREVVLNKYSVGATYRGLWQKAAIDCMQEAAEN